MNPFREITDSIPTCRCRSALALCGPRHIGPYSSHAIDSYRQRETRVTDISRALRIRQQLRASRPFFNMPPYR